MQNAVSIDPGEFVEVPQPMVFCGPPDLKRLHPLDACPVFGGETTNLVSCSLASEGFGGFADGKRRLAVGRVTPGEDRKLPDEMIQSRSHVLKTVSNEEAEGKWRGFSDMNPEDVLAAVRLALVGDKIRVSLEKSVGLSIECFQVLLCPIEL
jgi:hypothetical protein